MAALIVAADSTSERYITAGLTLLAAIVLVVVVHRAMRGRTRKIAEALGAGAVVDTRLRFLRRLVEAAIIIIGLALAISEFTSLDRFASSLDPNGVLTVDTGKITLGPLPVALGHPGLIPPKSPVGCI